MWPLGRTSDNLKSEAGRKTDDVSWKVDGDGDLGPSPRAGWATRKGALCLTVHHIPDLAAQLLVWGNCLHLSFLVFKISVKITPS